MTRVRDSGIEEHVDFFNRFAGQAELLNFISACDVYVTPYLNETQMTSGTLAYSSDWGRPSSRRRIGTPRNFWPAGLAFWSLSGMQMP